MSAVANLIAALTAAAASVTNDIDRLDCLVLIEEYSAALTAQSTSTSSNVSSYSINGRSVQYRSLSELDRRVSQLRSGIDSYIYGGQGGVVDNRRSLTTL